MTTHGHSKPLGSRQMREFTPVSAMHKTCGLVAVASLELGLPMARRALDNRALGRRSGWLPGPSGWSGQIRDIRLAADALMLGWSRSNPGCLCLWHAVCRLAVGLGLAVG